MERAEFEKKPIQDHWSKMVIVTGQPGNRSDMVGGWIADNNYRKFIPVRWSVDPVWGNSGMQHAWNWISIDPNPENIKHQREVKSVIREIFHDQYRVDARWAVTKSHLTSPTLIKFIPEELYNHFIILDIIANDHVSIAQIEWEAFVKNILRLLVSLDPFDHELAQKNLENNLLGVMDYKDKTVMQMLEFKYQFMSSLAQSRSVPKKNIYNTSATDSPVKVSSLDYRELMTPRGPFMLSEALGVQLDRSEWESAVEMARSKDRYWAMNRWWERPRCE